MVRLDWASAHRSPSVSATTKVVIMEVELRNKVGNVAGASWMSGRVKPRALLPEALLSLPPRQHAPRSLLHSHDYRIASSPGVSPDLAVWPVISCQRLCDNLSLHYLPNAATYTLEIQAFTSNCARPS